MSRTVLLIDDDASVREALAQTLELADIEVVAAGSFVAAKDRITERFNGIILSDMRMPGRDGFHLLSYAYEQDPDLPVILLTGEKPGLEGLVTVVAITFAVLLIMGITMQASGYLENALGKVGINVITRLLGMLLAALSVQFVLDGLSAFGFGPGPG